MYSLVPEKPLRLVYEPFYLAIRQLFKDFLRVHHNLDIPLKSATSSGAFRPPIPD
jgi:hypothetical protein